MIIVLLLLSKTVFAQVISPYLTEVNYSIGIDYLNGQSVNILHNQVIIDTIMEANSSDTPTVIGQMRRARVDGYHLDRQGLQYFSFDQDTRVNGFSVLKSDIIRCNDAVCSSFNYVFNALAESMQSLNINAFTFDPDNGDVIFSLESAGRIGISEFLASDLIRYDGTNYSLAYDATTEILTQGSSNIDGIMLLQNNRYLASFANESARHEVYEFDRGASTWSVAYTPLSFGSNYNSVNLTSLMAFENDTIFNNGFGSLDIP